MKTAILDWRETMRELDAGAKQDIALIRRVQARLGRRLAEIDRIGRERDFGPVGATTFAQYCEKSGLSAGEGFQLRGAARAFARAPELEKKVSERSISVPKAAAIEPMLRKPELQKPGDDWIGWAQTSTTRELGDLVRQRKAEARLEEPPTSRTLHFSSKGAAELTRARELVSAKRRRPVSDSEAAETAIGEYVERHDPERKLVRARKRQKKRETERGRAGEKTPGRSDGATTDLQAKSRNGARSASRSPSPGAAPRSRYIPAEERRRVLEMHGNRCWVEGCDERSFMAFAHKKAWRFRGKNVATNLARYCYEHHRQADGGLWRVVQARAGPILVDRNGVVVGRLRGPPIRAP